MNQAQKNYTNAKAKAAAIEARINKIDAAITTACNAKDEEGNLITVSWHLPDELFDGVNAKFAEALAETTLQDESNAAAAEVKKAEAELIRFALSIVPATNRKVLEADAEHNYTTRKKIIELALSLDTRTIPKHLTA